MFNYNKDLFFPKNVEDKESLYCTGYIDENLYYEE